MKKTIIVVPSHDGAEYDLSFLPPNDDLALAKEIAEKVVAEVKAELGEDIDGEAGSVLIKRLECLGFVSLDLVFVNDNYDN